MASPRRPASENYKSVCCSVSQSISYSSEAGILDDDHAPIFSLSKSSMDVVMATGPPHKRDPAWTRMDLKRSSSTNTHSEQHPATLQQLQPHIWQHFNAASSHQLSPTTQSVDLHSPPALSERWINNMQRWSGCSSSSTHSRSSTPDTVVYRGRSSRPSSLTQDAICSAVPDSPMSKLTSAPTTPSPFISPLHTPTLPPVDLLNSPSPRTHQQQPESAPTSSPLQTHTSPPFQSNAPEFLRRSEDEGFLENNLLMFQFPSPILSSASLAEAGVSSDPGCLVDDEMEKLPSPRGVQVLEGEGARSPVQTFTFPAPKSSPGRGAPVSHLELPCDKTTDKSFLTGRGRRSPLVSSLSDSRLGGCCRCKKSEAFREEATMTSQLDLVDATVQTSPVSSWWELRRNTSNMGSHSILGSPPGSRLNLKSSVGSNSNLVSPSSSMFPVSSGEEEEERRGRDPAWYASPLALEGRRSCLKSQQEEKDEMGRRSSMKQVQWDEDGMTWDVHGASVDPEVLSTAIQKHLQLQNSPRPLRRSSKKKKAPKPPVISNVVRAMVPEINPAAVITTSTCMAEGESKEMPEAGEETEQVEGGNKEETEETPRRRSRADGDKEEEDEVYGEEGNPPSSGNSHKKSVIRSLRRPGWCGGSRKADD